MPEELFIKHGVAEHILVGQRPEFTARAVSQWLEHLGGQTRCMEPGNPWQKGYYESFDGNPRDELLNVEIF